MKWYNYVELAVSLGVTFALLSILDGKHLFYGYDNYSFYLMYYK